MEYTPIIFANFSTIYLRKLNMKLETDERLVPHTNVPLLDKSQTMTVELISSDPSHEIKQWLLPRQS
jgi:hypothetical protein